MDQEAVLMLYIQHEFNEWARSHGPAVAYRKLAHKYHPDKSTDTLQEFQCLEALYAPYKEEERFQKQRQADLARLAELDVQMATRDAEEEAERAQSRRWRQERAEREAKRQAKREAKRAKSEAAQARTTNRSTEPSVDATAVTPAVSPAPKALPDTFPKPPRSRTATLAVAAPGCAPLETADAVPVEDPASDGAGPPVPSPKRKSASRKKAPRTLNTGVVKANVHTMDLDCIIAHVFEAACYKKKTQTKHRNSYKTIRKNLGWDAAKFKKFLLEPQNYVDDSTGKIALPMHIEHAIKSCDRKNLRDMLAYVGGVFSLQ